MVMEGGDIDMEADITTHQDEEQLVYGGMK
jgi:hypothetical protein